MDFASSLFEVMQSLNPEQLVHVTEREEPTGNCFVMATLTASEYMMDDGCRAYDDLPVIEHGPAGRGGAYEVVVPGEPDYSDWR